MTKSKLFSTHNMTLMAVYSAIATILAIFPHIHSPFGPLLEIEFSDVPVVLAAFYVHPVCAIVVDSIKTLIHLGFTESGFIGEAVTFVQAIVYIVPFFFFRKKQTRGNFAAKLSVSFVLDILFGTAAGTVVLAPFLVNIPSAGLLSLLAVYYTIRSGVITFASFILGMGVHKALTAHAPPIFLTRTDAKRSAPIDLSVPFVSNGPRDTARFAAAVAATLRDGDVLELVGDLGAGKTTFTKYLGKTFGIEPDRILSPTFVLMKSYDGTTRLTHADLYRVESAEEAAEAGILECIGEGIFVVEWADVIRPYLPSHKVVSITKGDGNVRVFEVKEV